MLGLPAFTETREVLSKKDFLDLYYMKSKRHKSFDSEISKIIRVNIVSPETMNIEAGIDVSSFSVVRLSLRCKDYDKINIGYIARLLQQNVLFVMEHQGMQQLSIWHNKQFIMMDWTEPEKLHLEFTGTNLDEVWQNIVDNAVNEKIAKGWIPEEELTRWRKIQRVEKEIAKYEKLAETESQPNRKQVLLTHIMGLHKILEEL